MQDTELAYIMLTSEEDGSQLVKAKVHMDAAYQRQQGATSHEPHTPYRLPGSPALTGRGVGTSTRDPTTHD